MDMFTPLSYLEWVNEHYQNIEIDLASSVLAGDTVGYDAVFEEPEPSGSLADQIATHYPTVEAADILPTAGASHGNALVAMAALARSKNAGITDPEVIVESPGYEPLVATPRGLGGTIRRVPRPRNRGYDVDLQALKETLSTETALVTLTNRHNPSGRILDRDRLRALADVVGKRNAILLVDEVYAPTVRSGDVDPTGGLGGPTAAGLANTVITQSFTKFLGYPGLRLGWIIADEPFRSHLRTMANHFPVVSHPSMALGSRILADGHTVAEQRGRLESSTRRLATIADRDDVVGQAYPGSTFAFLGHESTDGDAVADAAMDVGVLVVPGRFFGEPDRFRVCACQPSETIEQGFDRLETVLDRL